jgi:hypothetical protein
MNKTVKLSIEPDFDFPLVAIISTEPIYRMGFLINEAIACQLKENTPLQVYHVKRQIVQEFPLFSFYTDDSFEAIHLIQNKSLQGLFIEEQKQVDFWMKWENLDVDMKNVLKALKKIPNVSLAFEVKPGELKSKSRLLFSVEESD